MGLFLGMERFFITTAIPYVNARPHLGFALEMIQADAFARFRRIKGLDVRFLTGADENSLSNVQAAEAEGVPTQQLVDRNAGYFRDLKHELNISFDDFIRTSVDPRHLNGAAKLWRACEQAGDIYRKPYRGLYCVGCEQFYTEEELIDGLCPEHHTVPELIEEENYFFRLSSYADRIAGLIEQDVLQIVPQSRKNEVLSFIKMGLHDFSISRSRRRARGWGVAVPGDEEQVMYVWFDALSNYINALDYAGEGELFNRYWASNPNRVHVIGKGIIRFHAVYWPAMLLSAGIPLPAKIFVHGYITVHGTKMSKTLGNVVDPVELAGKFGIDPLRYYLLRKIPPTDDGNFTLDSLIQSYNSDLADQLGNLLSRFVGMVERYYDGVVPAPVSAHEADEGLKRVAGTLPKRLNQAMEGFSPQDALGAVWDLVAEANRYVVEVQPWSLAKARSADTSAEQRLSTVLYNLAEVLRMVALGCAPFLPDTSNRIFEQLGVHPPSTGLDEALVWGGFPAGTRLQPAANLFPKIHPAQQERENEGSAAG